MQRKTKAVAVFILLGTSFVFAGCPHHHRRPHIPHPHHLTQSLLPLDSSFDMAVYLARA